MNFKGFAKRWTYIAVGLLYAIPQSLILAYHFLRNPRNFFGRQNWSALTLPAPVPDLHHVMVDISPEISIHTVRTFKGRPTKPVMVLVHGFPEYWASWRNQIKEFRDEYDIVAISMRGYSLSSKPQAS